MVPGLRVHFSMECICCIDSSEVRYVFFWRREGVVGRSLSLSFCFDAAFHPYTYMYVYIHTISVNVMLVLGERGGRRRGELKDSYMAAARR